MAVDGGADRHGGPGDIGSARDEVMSSRLPSHRRRLEAFGVDVFLVALVFGLAFALDSLTDLPGWGLVVAAAVVWIYYVGVTAWLMDGQSAGKTIYDLRVAPVGADEVAHTFRGLVWSVGRHTVGYVVTDVFLLGAMFALVNRRRRCLHDYAFASEVTSEVRTERPASFAERYRSYWETFAQRYDDLAERLRWLFLPWKWLSKSLVVVAVLLDKLLPAESASSAPGVPAPTEPAHLLSAGSTTGLWAGTAALSGLLVVTAWPSDAVPVGSVDVVVSLGNVGEPQSKEIYRMRADGSDPTRLTRNDSSDVNPDLFADQRVVFDSDRDGGNDVYVMDADGSGQSRLTSGDGYDWCPKWSPDGSRIAFTSDRDGNTDVYVMEVDGSNQRRVTSDPAADQCPSWSPGGDRVAFTSDRGGSWNIYTIGVDGSGARQITDDPAGDFDPVWSPDGALIAFTSVRDGDQNVYTVDPATGRESRVTDDPANDRHAIWVLGGRRLLFWSDRGLSDGGAEVYATEPDGSGQRRLTSFNGCGPDTSTCNRSAAELR